MVWFVLLESDKEAFGQNYWREPHQVVRGEAEIYDKGKS